MYDINPIKPLIELPLFTITEIIIIGIIFGISVCIFLLYLIINIRKYFIKKQYITSIPIVPIVPKKNENILLKYQQELDYIAQELNQKSYRTFSEKISVFFKKVLSEYYKENITEKTTAELKQILLTKNINYQKIINILTILDQVKFAKNNLEEKTAQESYEQANLLLDKLKNIQ